MEESQNDYLEVLNNLANEIYIFDKHSLEICWVNRFAIKNSYYSFEEFLTLKILDITKDLRKNNYRDYLSSIEDKGRDKLLIFTNLYRKDKTYYPVEIQLRKTRFKGNDACIFVGTDITERKELLKLVYYQEKKLSEVSKLTKLGHWEWDINSNIFFWSDYLYQIYEVDISSFKPDFEKFIEFIYPADKEKVINSLEETLYNDEIWSENYRIIVRGKIKYVRTKAHKEKDEYGKVIRLIASTQDISNEIIQDELIKEKEYEFRSLINNLDIIVWKYDLEEEIFYYVSDQFEDILGFPKSLFYRVDFIDNYFKHSDIKKFKNEIKNAIIKHQDKTDFEIEIKNKQLEYKTFRTKINLPYKQNKTNDIFGLFIDISKSKKTEEDLRLSQAKYREFIINITEGVFRLEFFDKIKISSNLDNIIENILNSGYIAESNDEFARILGFYESNDIIEKPISDIIYITDDIRDLIRNLVSNAFILNNYELEMVNIKGYKKNLKVHAHAVTKKRKLLRIWATVKDESKLKLAEQRLAENQKRYYDFLKESSDGIYQFELNPPVSINMEEDEQIKFIYSNSKVRLCNDSYAKMYGFEKAKNLINLKLSDIKDFDKELQLSLRNFIRQSYKIASEPIVEKGKDSSIKYLVYNSHAYIDDGHITFIWGSQKDITNLKETEEALLESDRRYKNFIRNSSEAIYRLEFDKPIDIREDDLSLTKKIYEKARVSECNDEMSHIYGFKDSELLIGKYLHQIMNFNEEFIVSYKHFIENEFRWSGLETIEKDRYGNTIYFLNFSHAVIEDNYIIRIWGTKKDISKQKNIENALLESQNRYQGFIQNSSEGIYRIEFYPTISVKENPEKQVEEILKFGRIQESNSRFANMMGFGKKESILNKQLFVLYKNNKHFKKYFKKFIENNYRFGSEEIEYHDENGKKHYFLDSSHSVIEKGKILRIWGSRKEITDYKVQQSLILKQQKRLSIAERIAHVGNYEFNFTTNDIYWSEESKRIIGITDEKKELSFNKFLNLVHKDDIHLFDLSSYNSEEINFEFRIIAENGQIKYLFHQAHIYFGASSTVERIFGTLFDITRQKKAEQRALDTEKLLTSVNKNISEAIYRSDENGNLLYCNDSFLQLFRYERKEEIYIPKLYFVADERKRWIEILKKIGEIRSLEVELIRKDKTRFWGLESIREIVLEDGSRVFDGSIRDITERKKYEVALMESEERYKSLFTNIPIPMIIHVNEKIKFVNHATISSMAGKSQNDFIDKNIEVFFNSAENNKDINYRNRRGKGFNHERALRLDGKFIDIEISSTEIEYYGEKAIQIVFHDITEELRIEAELQNMQKLESIGILAGGIAHDFNNILMGFLANLSMAKIYLKEGRYEKLDERLRESEKACTRAKDLTQQLLTFSKGGRPKQRTIHFKKFLEDSVSFALRGSKIKAEIKIIKSLKPVSIDEGQVNQVINNIVINANQAMPDGGRLYVKANNVKIKNNYKLVDGDYIRVSIRDTGTGIDKESLGKIFDPYFTTKLNGSGLGLATSYSIINKHNGLITVESEQEKGTTFNIFLPVSNEKIFNRKTRVKKNKIFKGSIAVLDDEEPIRIIMEKMLRRMGFNVKLYSTGNDLIGDLKEQQFDIYILDLTIAGGIGGKKVAEEIRSLKIDTKIIASSGYSNDPIISQYKDYGFDMSISKPFTYENLNRLIASLL